MISIRADEASRRDVAAAVASLPLSIVWATSTADVGLDVVDGAGRWLERARAGLSAGARRVLVRKPAPMAGDAAFYGLDASRLVVVDERGLADSLGRVKEMLPDEQGSLEATAFVAAAADPERELLDLALALQRGWGALPRVISASRSTRWLAIAGVIDSDGRAPAAVLLRVVLSDAAEARTVVTWTGSTVRAGVEAYPGTNARPAVTWVEDAAQRRILASPYETGLRAALRALANDEAGPDHRDFVTAARFAREALQAEGS
jgi:hypothetical protein